MLYANGFLSFCFIMALSIAILCRMYPISYLYTVPHAICKPFSFVLLCFGYIIIGNRSIEKNVWAGAANFWYDHERTTFVFYDKH